MENNNEQGMVLTTLQERILRVLASSYYEHKKIMPGIQPTFDISLSELTRKIYGYNIQNIRESVAKALVSLSSENGILLSYPTMEDPDLYSITFLDAFFRKRGLAVPYTERLHEACRNARHGRILCQCLLSELLEAYIECAKEGDMTFKISAEDIKKVVPSKLDGRDRIKFYRWMECAIEVYTEGGLTTGAKLIKSPKGDIYEFTFSEDYDKLGGVWLKWF